MTAGAGAGKTGALVACVRSVLSHRRDELKRRGSTLAVITFTKAAALEAKHRIGETPVVTVSTIHSFAWRMIAPLTADLKVWRRDRLQSDLEDLRTKEQQGRVGTQASAQRLRSIEHKERALMELDRVEHFIYSATGGDQGAAELSHSDVLSAFSWISEKSPLMHDLIASSHPFIFVDEVQDTRTDVLQALITAAVRLPNRLSLGLFGDSMQRVYNEGPMDLNALVPAAWDRPVLPLNYRSAKRIVTLLNTLRSGTDGLQQTAITGTAGGIRLFLESPTTMHPHAESDAMNWLSEIAEPKVLILEHALASHRLGFESLWGIFSAKDSAIRSEIFDAESITSPTLTFLSEVLAPFANLARNGERSKANRFLQEPARMATVFDGDSSTMPKRARGLYETLSATGLSGREAVDAAIKSRLFQIPQLLEDASVVDESLPTEPGEDSRQVERALAWSEALSRPLLELEALAEYALGLSSVDTQQGTKGLEFDSVLVVLDDGKAKGFLYRYGKLFEVEKLSARDEENLENANDNVLSRTLRLFYVACSRARTRLAVVMFTSDPATARKTAVEKGWFSPAEIAVSE